MIANIKTMLQSMQQKLNSTMAVMLLAGAVAVPVAVPAAVAAQPADNEIQPYLCSGAELDINGGQQCDAAQTSGDKLNNLIRDIINVVSIIVGIVAVVMIIVGGLKYITSGGESSNVSSAKNTIIYAIIGLVVVALAQFIVRFVLGKTSDATVFVAPVDHVAVLVRSLL